MGILVSVWTSFERQPLGVFGGSHAGRQRVAGIKCVVHDAPALHAVRRAKSAAREHVALPIAVSARIGVDQAAHGAMLSTRLWA